MPYRALDLFSSAGGAGWGYKCAGFEVVGVDLKKRQCGYPPGQFIKADCMDVLENVDFLRTFDIIHASPPCQDNSRTKHLRDAQGGTVKKHGLNLIGPVREALERSGVHYIMENVEGSDLRQDVVLCGSMFENLYVMDETGKRWLKRHRVFESDIPLFAPAKCDHKGAGVRPLGVYGSKGDNIPSGGQTCKTLEQAQALMGIDWMSWAAIIEAIPPAYTYWLGNLASKRITEDRYG